ncbi:hypothetical protein [Paenibacillus periandrae]|uniref:hypothetical protein n=1 Tax=Paenibacillus periandrae TaxID=1761741 RepID=UPI001F08B03B|nr:hypothetical protein [Paenibacillus periandrae]
MKILVTAESFGYGPIITCLNVIEKLKRRTVGTFSFLGSGVSMEQAKLSELFDEYVECDTFSSADLKKHDGVFNEASFIVSSENIEGAIYGVKAGKKVFYIDNLFWMWDEIPQELGEVDTYFIAESLDISSNLSRFKNSIRRLKIVGPLRQVAHSESIKNNNKVNQLLINFGGAESFMIDKHLIYDYYECLLSKILDVTTETFSSILVCGGSGLIKELQSRTTKLSLLSFCTFSNEEYLEKLNESTSIVLSPGLGNFFEVLNQTVPVLFIPPINFSQFWQIEDYKKYSTAFDQINWSNFEWGHHVDRCAKEELGVNQVLQNVKYFLESERAQKEVAHHIKNFFMKPHAYCNYGEERQKIVSCLKPNGIDTVVNEILKRSRQNEYYT